MLFQLLIENVFEELDPILEPILLRQIWFTGGTYNIQLGEAIIEYDTNFRYLFVLTYCLFILINLILYNYIFYQ